MKKLKELKKEYEKFLIETVLENTNGDVNEASKVLKMTDSTLYMKINEYKLNHNKITRGSK